MEIKKYILPVLISAAIGATAVILHVKPVLSYQKQKLNLYEKLRQVQDKQITELQLTTDNFTRQIQNLENTTEIRQMTISLLEQTVSIQEKTINEQSNALNQLKKLYEKAFPEYLTTQSSATPQPSSRQNLNTQ